MLKNVLYYLMLAVTAFRLADLVFLLMQEAVNLPMAVIVTTTGMILYAVVLLMRRFLSSVRLRPMMVYFIVQSAVLVFNLFYVGLSSPLVPTLPETLLIGSFLEVLIYAALVYLCLKKTRNRSFVTVGHLQ